jgi:hypothetical protein
MQGHFFLRVPASGKIGNDVTGASFIAQAMRSLKPIDYMRQAPVRPKKDWARLAMKAILGRMPRGSGAITIFVVLRQHFVRHERTLGTHGSMGDYTWPSRNRSGNTPVYSTGT